MLLDRINEVYCQNNILNVINVTYNKSSLTLLNGFYKPVSFGVPCFLGFIAIELLQQSLMTNNYINGKI
jgi:hypothetical protein